jgi:hypothetical protein
MLNSGFRRGGVRRRRKKNYAHATYTRSINPRSEKRKGEKKASSRRRRQASACARKSLLSQMSSCERVKLFITEKLLLKKFSKHKNIYEREMLYLRDGRGGEGRAYVKVFSLPSIADASRDDEHERRKTRKKWKLFSFPIYVTSKAFVSQQCRTVRRRAKAETTFTS